MSLLSRLLLSGQSIRIISESLSLSSTAATTIYNSLTGLNSINIAPIAGYDENNISVFDAPLSLLPLFNDSVACSSIVVGNIAIDASAESGIGNLGNISSNLSIGISAYIDHSTKILVDKLIENIVLAYNTLSKTCINKDGILFSNTILVESSIRRLISDSVILAIDNFVNTAKNAIYEETYRLSSSILDSALSTAIINNSLYFSILEQLRQRKYVGHIADIIDLISQNIEPTNISNGGVYYSAKINEGVRMSNILNENIAIYSPQTSFFASSIINEEIVC